MDPRFGAHAVRNGTAQLWRVSQGTTFEAVGSAELDAFALANPPRPEQSRIAEVLDTLDNAIRATEQVIAKLEMMRQGLLHDLLTLGIDEHGEVRDLAKAPSRFGATPLGTLPRAWKIEPLGLRASLVKSGSRGWARYYSDCGALFLRIGNLTRRNINLRLDDTVRVRPPPSGEGTRTRVEVGDVLISITADLGIIGVVRDGLGEAYINQHIALIRMNKEQVNSRWVGHYLSGRAAQEQFRRLNDSGAKAGLNLPAVSEFRVPLPPRVEQDAIAERLDRTDRLLEHEQGLARKLQCIRRGLSDDLLTGRVRVKVPGGGMV